MKEKNLVILLFFVSLLIKIPLSFLALNGFGVDESLYQTLAREFLETGNYGIKINEPSFSYDETFVAPLFPLTQAVLIFAFGPTGTLIISPLFSSLFVVVAYYLGKEMINNFVGKLSALFILLNPALFLLGVRPLTESLGLFLFTLSFLILYRSLKKQNYLLFLPTLIFLTFVARYSFGFLLIPTILITLVFRKKFYILFNKNLFFGIILSLAIASPWFLFNLQISGNLIGSALHQASTDVTSSISSAISFTRSVLPVIGAFSPFVLYGIYAILKNKKYILPLILLFALFILQISLFGKFAEERYLIHILPFSGIIMAFGVQDLLKKINRKKLVTYLFVLFTLINIGTSLYVTNFYANLPKYIETKKVSLWAKDNCSSPVMSNDFTHIWFYTDFTNIPYSSDKDLRNELIQRYNVSCVIVNKFESPYSDNLETNGVFEKIFSTNNTVVYKIIR